MNANKSKMNLNKNVAFDFPFAFICVHLRTAFFFACNGEVSHG